MIQQQAALVTGGSRGIGRAAALALARLGMNVAVNYLRHRAAAEEVVAAIQVKGRQGIAIQADVGDAAEARGLGARAIEQWGRLDVLVSNAGIVERAPVLDLASRVRSRFPGRNPGFGGRRRCRGSATTAATRRDTVRRGPAAAAGGGRH